MSAARKRARKRPARREASREREVTLPKWSLELMERQLDREIARWARKLLWVIDGEVRKLTEEQVQQLVQSSKRGDASSRPKPKRRAAKRLRKRVQ